MRRNTVRRWLVTACLLTTLTNAACAAGGRSVAPAKVPPGVTWLIFVDDLHIDFRNTGRVRNLLRSISTELIRDEDVFAMRSSGPTAIDIAANSDRARLEAAIRTITGASLRVSEIAAGASQSRDEIALRLGLTFSAASELLDNVPASPSRRRVLVYVSNGYDFEPGRARASDFSAVARRTNVIVFAMNAGGLPGSRVDNSSVDPAFWIAVAASRHQSLRMIAEPTGGFAVLDDAGFAGALSRIRTSLK